jgi:DNA-binding NarL/FixJ family response regulator
LQIVCEAKAGQKGFKKSKKDLILLDESLSKLNGIEVARQIAKLAPEPKNVIAGL